MRLCKVALVTATETCVLLVVLHPDMLFALGLSLVENNCHPYYAAGINKTCNRAT